jgi:hypothetical protein
MCEASDQDARVVDPGVHGAASLDEPVRRRADGLGVGDVEWKSPGPIAELPRR